MKLNKTARFILNLSAQPAVAFAVISVAVWWLMGISDEISLSVSIILIIVLSVAWYMQEAKRENKALPPAQMTQSILYQSAQLAVGLALFILFILFILSMVFLPRVWRVEVISYEIWILSVSIILIIVLSVAWYMRVKRQNKALSPAQIARRLVLYQFAEFTVGAALFILFILSMVFLPRVWRVEVISYEIWAFSVSIILIIVLSAALYMLVKRQNKAFSPAQAALKSCYIIGFVFIITFMLIYDFLFPAESMMAKKIKDVEINRAVKVADLIDGQWDAVCVLTPYSESFQEDGSEGIKNEDIKVINRKIENAELSTGETDWHLILKNPETTSITSETFRTARIQQNAFSSDAIELFSAINFSPASRCANFKDAYFLRYK